MVELLRIDDRLLHGQVAFSWVNRYAPDAILIANDEVMHNEIQKMAIKMAKPAGMKMAIKTLQDGIDLINNEHVKQMKLFVVVKTSRDALTLIQGVKEHIRLLNIGGISNRKKGGKNVAKGIYLSEEDIKNIKKIQKLIDEVDIRVVPTDPKKDIQHVL